MKPAPTDGCNSLIEIVKSSWRPNKLGLSDNEYCVFAIQTGNFPHLCSSYKIICFLASDDNSISAAPYTSWATFLILLSKDSFKSYILWKLLFSLFLVLSIILSASVIAPSPPFAHTSVNATSISLDLHQVSIKSVSVFVSVGNLLMDTTYGRPNFSIVSICFFRF